MSKDWLYEGKTYDPTYEEIPPEYVGFVYQITDTETGGKVHKSKMKIQAKYYPCNSIMPK